MEQRARRTRKRAVQDDPTIRYSLLARATCAPLGVGPPTHPPSPHESQRARRAFITRYPPSPLRQKADGEGPPFPWGDTALSASVIAPTGLASPPAFLGAKRGPRSRSLPQIPLVWHQAARAGLCTHQQISLRPPPGLGAVADQPSDRPRRGGPVITTNQRAELERSLCCFFSHCHTKSQNVAGKAYHRWQSRPQPRNKWPGVVLHSIVLWLTSPAIQMKQERKKSRNTVYAILQAPTALLKVIVHLLCIK